MLGRVVGELRAAAARRQLDCRDLASRTSYSPDAVQRCLSGSRPYLRVIRELDRVLAPRLDPADRWAIEGAYAAVGLESPSPEPVQHPLAFLVGGSWQWLGRPERGTVVLLSDYGAWTEVSVLGQVYDLAAWREVAAALAARERSPGRFLVVTERGPVGWTARTEPAAQRTDCLSGS